MQSRDLLGKYVDFSLSEWDQKLSFFIVSGPAGIWKSSVILEIAQKKLWNYFFQDFLHIKDFSQKIGRRHNLKVSLDEWSEVSKLLMDEYSYQDIWTREINQWLVQSITGNAKIVLVENIERMTIGAVNAFLKSAEEPLKKRIIIATTSNVSHIIDTILSRAVVIPFFELSQDELVTFCEEHQLFPNHAALRKFLCFMSMWKPWLMKRFHEIFSSNESLIKEFEEMVSLLSSSWQLHRKHQFLIKISQLGLLDQFIDGLIAFFVDKKDFDHATTWLQIKKWLITNVSIENLLFSWLLV